MSKVAKNIMAKYGWKDGDGLGKDRSGVVSHVKVVRRDPKTATGLGHLAEAGSTIDATTVELDDMYRTISSPTSPTSPGVADSSDDEGTPERKRQRSSSSSSSSSSSDDHSTHGEQLTDAELFRRCGGVRLGRGGRHRCFDGKLERVARSNQATR